MPTPSPRRTRLRWRIAAAAALVGGLLLLSAGVAGAQAFPPEAVSEEGSDIRNLYILVFFLAAAVFIVVEAAIIWLVFKYRRRDDALPPQIHGHRGVEILWTVIPSIIVLVLFIVSFIVLDDIESAPGEYEPVEVIDVTAQQWAWSFYYATPMDATTSVRISDDPADVELRVSDGSLFEPFKTYRIDVEHIRVDSIEGNILTVARGVNGTVVQHHPAGEEILRITNGTEVSQDDRGELTDSIDPSSGAVTTMNTPIVTVPVGKTVRFNISSLDVIHSFYAPQFLYKLDAMPGRTQALWLKVTDAGFFQGQCAEFCGREHARMLFSVRALPLEEYDAWLAALVAPPPPAEEAAPADDAGDDASMDEGDAADDAGDTDAADDSGDAGAADIGAGTDPALELGTSRYGGPAAPAGLPTHLAGMTAPRAGAL